MAALGVLTVGILAAGYTVDDAYIVGRFAQNLAGGEGYGLNPGEPADGLTGPLWIVPGWIAASLGLDPVAIAKGTGLLCAAVAAGLVVRRLAARARGRRTAPTAAALLIASPSLGTWGVAGLETGAAALLLTVAVLGATHRPRAQATATGLAIGALAWLRPELAFVAAGPLLVLWRRSTRALARALALACAGAAGVLIFRQLSFGHALPLSFDAKAGDLGHGVGYALRSLALATSVVGLWLAGRGARSGRVDDLLLGCGLAAHIPAVMLAGGDWMPGYRLLTPVLPLYAMLAALGAARLRSRRRWPLVLVTALACSVPLADLATRLPEHRAAARSQAGAAEISAWLKANACHVALVDVGLLPYQSGVRVLDLGAITDAEIARLPGGHLDKRIGDTLLRERDPDLLLLHSARLPAVDDAGRLRGLAGYPVERRVAALPWVREHFRVARVFTYRPGYLYVALTRSQESPAEDHEGHAQELE